MDVKEYITALVKPETGLTKAQSLLLDAMYPPSSPEEYVDRLPDIHDKHNAVLCVLVLKQVPIDVATRIKIMQGLDPYLKEFVFELAQGQMDLAVFDFERNGYTSVIDLNHTPWLHVDIDAQSPWTTISDSPMLANKWAKLEYLPENTLGKLVWQMYRSRGFCYPGSPGSAPPLLAQHDWVHVLADYGTTVESELEVFSFIAKASGTPKAFSFLATVVALFESCNIERAVGLFECDVDHISKNPKVAVRMADAMRRGNNCPEPVEFMQLDWFAYADWPVDKVREHFMIPPKSAEAIAAGSVGPWEPGGISSYQQGAGMMLAEAEGRPYISYGAEPLEELEP